MHLTFKCHASVGPNFLRIVTISNAGSAPLVCLHCSCAPSSNHLPGDVADYAVATSRFRQLDEIEAQEDGSSDVVDALRGEESSMRGEGIAWTLWEKVEI